MRQFFIMEKNNKFFIEYHWVKWPTVISLLSIITKCINRVELQLIALFSVCKNTSLRDFENFVLNREHLPKVIIIARIQWNFVHKWSWRMARKWTSKRQNKQFQSKGKRPKTYFHLSCWMRRTVESKRRFSLILYFWSSFFVIMTAWIIFYFYRVLSQVSCLKSEDFITTIEWRLLAKLIKIEQTIFKQSIKEHVFFYSGCVTRKQVQWTNGLKQIIIIHWIFYSSIISNEKSNDKNVYFSIHNKFIWILGENVQIAKYFVIIDNKIMSYFNDDFFFAEHFCPWARLPINYWLSLATMLFDLIPLNIILGLKSINCQQTSGNVASKSEAYVHVMPLFFACQFDWTFSQGNPLLTPNK